MATTTPAGTRADAVKNRAHILEIAESVFSKEGVTGSMDTIAKRAGVGVGTLYRHFASRTLSSPNSLRSRDDTLQVRRGAIDREWGDSATALEEWPDALGEWGSAFDRLSKPCERR